MNFVIQSLSAGNKEQEFREKYEDCYFLGSDHEGVTERYSIESGSNELGFGLGVAVAITSVEPKVLFAEKQRILFIGFDSFIAAVSIVKPSSAEIEHRLLRLDGVFVDMVLLQDETVCVIHEVGALVTTTNLTKVCSISTDVISDWIIDDERQILSLTEADSGAVVCLSVSTGTILIP